MKDSNPGPATTRCTMGKEISTITIIGPLPPPRGGVSIHIARLAQLLREDGVRVRVLPWAGVAGRPLLVQVLLTVRQLARIAWFVPTAGRSTVHLHYSHLAGFFALAPWILLAKSRWVLTLHSVKLFDECDRGPSWRRQLVRKLLRRFALIVCVRQSVADKIRHLDLPDVATLIMPAFLPPSLAERESTLLATDLRDKIVHCRRTGALLLFCAAYKLGAAYGKDDVYGVEMLIDLLIDVGRQLSRQIFLVVMISYQPVGAAALAAERIAHRSAGIDYLHVDLREDEPLVPCLVFADAFLRPSREDGDSVAIREALDLGCPVWASDAVERPSGCMVFPLGDRKEALRSLQAFLKGLPPEPEMDRSRDPDMSQYRDFIARLLGRSKDDSAPR